MEKSEHIDTIIESVLDSVNFDIHWSDIQQASSPKEQSQHPIQNFVATVPSQIVASNSAVTYPLTLAVQQNETDTSLVVASSSISVPASSTSSTPSSSNEKRKRKKHWLDWKDQMAEQLSKRMEDTNFVVKQCHRCPPKPKPYEKYTQEFHFK